ncbi:phosphate ABC transporter permease subunit PstC [Natronococcus occultus]|uniref:Phosphate transport system permease protein n=1 Tax=Natronococcus occultus SP4 TaxID=694430 RepID=L0JY32_9EURY|nr:phosphate ABC transporter permease subunit PstC [Natronococcus occultus]AGB37210.1 phosphate ABC transporter membrane protein 1, PhoT family [Natronococcus occultus SP4]
MSSEPVDLSRTGNDVGTLGDRVARYAFFACALVTVLTTVAIILVLVNGAVGFFREETLVDVLGSAFAADSIGGVLDALRDGLAAQVTLVEFLTGTDWSPLIEPTSYGVLPLVWGTLVVTVGAAIIAVPVGTLTAIYLSEYADERVRRTLKPILEILAGIPTIVYGFFALSFITPIIQSIFPQTGTFNAASAAIVVGVMIIPMVSSLSEDAMSSVPDSLRNAAFGLGATRFEVSTQVVVPASLSGILAAYVLALSRAIGETMAVAIAMGMYPQISANLLEEMQTMTSYMVQVGISDVSVGSVQYQSLFAVGLLLFAMTFAMNVFSMWIRSRYREEYQ